MTAPANGTPLVPGGMLLGNGAEGPVLVRLFRPRPTLVRAFAPLALMQVVVLRAIALGAHVTVRTAQPRAWDPLLQLDTDGAGLEVVGADDALEGAGVAYRPVLLVDQTRSQRPQPRAWQAVVAWRDDGVPASVEQLRAADAVLMAAPDERMLDRVARAHALTLDQVDAVRGAGAGGLVLTSPRHATTVSVTLTDAEMALVPQHPR